LESSIDNGEHISGPGASQEVCTITDPV